MSSFNIFNPEDFGLDETDLTKESIAVSVISAAGGEVAGKIRLQKLVFLLDKLGLNSGFKYAYHHYGPYSSDLTEATDFAKAFGLIEEKVKHRQSDGAIYSVFSLGRSLGEDPKKEFFEELHISSTITAISAVNSTILELAATAYWLKHDECVDNWEHEIVRRKGSKTDNGRLQDAKEFLEKINLSVF
jgi:uncharacterized protein